MKTSVFILLVLVAVTFSEEQSAQNAFDHERVARAARYCGYTECSNHCRRLGHARGVCIGSYCQCRSRLARSADFKEEFSRTVRDIQGAVLNRFQ